MPKQCQYEGCKNNVFSHNFCRNHQMYRTDEKWLKSLQKQPKTQSKIKPVSEKRSKQLAIYENEKKEKIEQLKRDGKWFCFFCGKPFKENEKADCHHTKDRENDDLFDMVYTVFAHRNCHTAYHNLDYAHFSSFGWYLSFLERTKEIDIKLYEKEINKANK